MIKFKNEGYDLNCNVSRRFLHEAIDQESMEIDLEMVDEDELYEWVEQAHALVSAQDEKGLDRLIDPTDEGNYFILIKAQNLMDALDESGYDYNVSASTKSMYITNDDDDEVRISDHKKDLFNTVGIVTENGEITSAKLAEHGILLDEGVYVL